MAPAMLLKFSSLLSVYIILSFSLVSFTQSFMFLIRVRSNVGTWKLQLDSDDTRRNKGDLTVRDVLSDGIFEAWQLVQPLSLDPSGKEPLSKIKTLQQQGLKHGSMIYCRVEERDLLANDSDDNGNSLVSPTATTSQIKDQALQGKPGSKRKRVIDSKKNEVIELLSSDDEEDEVKIVPHTKRQPPSSTQASSTSAKRTTAKSTTSSSASKLSSTSSSINDFRIVSYNIWFGPPDPKVNQLYPRQRMQAIIQILKECNSNHKSPLLFVGFQEVTSSLRQYLFPDLEKLGYNLATQPLHTSYGVGLAVSKQVSVLESKFVPYPTSLQGRGLLYARTATHLFATTHMESFISKANNGIQERQVQIVLATKFCQEQLAKHPNLELAMVSGDFNWDDERKRGKGSDAELMSLLDDGWRDAGQPFDYTYDAHENCMLAGGLRRRFDRCIYLTNNKNSSSNITRVSLQKFGKDPIGPNLFWRKINPYNGRETVLKVAPSDHFAIGVRFQK